MLYGTVPFKAVKMKDLHKLIISGTYELKENISIVARDLLSNILEPDFVKRYGFQKIVHHIWFSNYDDSSHLIS